VGAEEVRESVAVKNGSGESDTIGCLLLKALTPGEGNYWTAPAQVGEGAGIAALKAWITEIYIFLNLRSLHAIY
jgi:hypothetical protein